MLRNTSNGNELALPLSMPNNEHRVGSRYPVYAMFQTALVTILCYLLSVLCQTVITVLNIDRPDVTMCRDDTRESIAVLSDDALHHDGGRS